MDDGFGVVNIGMVNAELGYKQQTRNAVIVASAECGVSPIGKRNLNGRRDGIQTRGAVLRRLLGRSPAVRRVNPHPRGCGSALGPGTQRPDACFAVAIRASGGAIP